MNGHKKQLLYAITGIIVFAFMAVENIHAQAATWDFTPMFVVTSFLIKMYLDKTKNPKSDAKISFTSMAGHCQDWSDKAVLTLIAEKVTENKEYL
jgi:hypothetical protein